MPWWGGGSGKDAGDGGMAAEKTDMALGADDFTADPGGDFGSSGPQIGSALPRSSGGGGAAGAPVSQEQLQRLVMAEQQKALVQQVIAKLTEVSFDACVAKPDGALSATERNCIHTVVGKYLDTSEFVMGRAQKKSEQANMLH